MTRKYYANFNRIYEGDVCVRCGKRVMKDPKP